MGGTFGLHTALLKVTVFHCWLFGVCHHCVIHWSTGCTACQSSPLPAFPTTSSQLELVCCQHGSWLCALCLNTRLVIASQRKRCRSLAVEGWGCVSVTLRGHIFSDHTSTVTLELLLCGGILVLHKVEKELNTRLPK